MKRVFLSFLLLDQFSGMKILLSSECKTQENVEFRSDFELRLKYVLMEIKCFPKVLCR